MARAALALAIPLALALAGGCQIPDRTFEVTDGGADRQELLVDPLALDIPEGMTGTFEVSLRHDPRGTVTAAITTESGSALLVDPAVLTFTSADYTAPHTVTVTAPVDANTASETSTITVSGAGAAGVETVTVRAVDSTQIDTWGWPTPFAGTFQIPAGFVYAYKLDVGAVASLGTFHTYVPAAAGTFKMALYTDAGNTPGTLVPGAEMLLAKVLVNGVNDSAPLVAPPLLDAPVYWLAIRFSQTTAIGYAGAGQTGRQCRRNVNIPDITLPWPVNFTSSTCAVDNLFNIWIATYHQ
jgi:hypothetical protein